MSHRTKLAALLGLHALWGIVLWFSISKYGLGISTDSVHLLFGGHNLASGNGLTSYDGGFLLLWPPLYPMLLALVHLATGADMLAAATILQWAAFAGISISSAMLFLRVFRGNLRLAASACGLADIGVVVLTSFDVVGSDYLELFLVILCMLLTGFYIRYGSGRTFVALVAAGMLAMLDRYVGAAAIATSAVCVIVLTGQGLGQKLVRGGVVVLGALPSVLWLAATSVWYDLRAPISFGENFSWFSKSMLEWFFLPRTVKAELEPGTIGLWILGVILCLAFVLAWRQYRRGRREQATGVRPPFSHRFMLPVASFGLAYTLALFGSASLTYFNKLGGRFLLPLYIPIVTVLVAAVAVLLERSRKSGSTALRLIGGAAGGGALLAMAALLLQVTLPLVSASHADGAAGGDNVFNTKAWNKNEAIIYWKAHAPAGQYMVFSNQPDAVAFFTGRPANGSPRMTSGPYGTDLYPLSSYPAVLFQNSQTAYLIWIEPSEATYLYSVTDISKIANVETLFASQDGSVYQLGPKAGP